MSNSHIPQIARFLSFLPYLLAGCASVPTFQPSTPLSDAKSLQEALILCDEYRLPVPARRPVLLRPFLDCVDRVSELGLVFNEGFQTFREEFHVVYGALSDERWSPEMGVEYEAAIHAVFRFLWRSPLVADEALVSRLFPVTARVLHARESSEDLDPKLERLIAGVAALSEMTANKPGRETDSASLDASEASVAIAESCERLHQLQIDTQHLVRLWHDQRDMTQLAPRSEVSAAARERYSRSLAKAIQDFEALRSAFRAKSCQHR